MVVGNVGFIIICFRCAAPSMPVGFKNFFRPHSDQSARRLNKVCPRVPVLIMSVPEIVRKLSRFWWQGLFIVAAVAAAGVLTLISLRDFQREAVPPENRPIQSQLAGYVSSNSCRPCHPGNYASWHASFHRTMTQVATPQSLPPSMDGLQLAYNGREYKTERRGDKRSEE